MPTIKMSQVENMPDMKLAAEKREKYLAFNNVILTPRRRQDSRLARLPRN